MDIEPLAGPQRPDPDVAAGIARQSRNAGQCRGGAGQDERGLCRAFRQGAEAGRRKVPSAANTNTMSTPIFVESQRGLGAIIEVRDAFYDNAEQILGAAYSSARLSFLIALAGLIAVAAASAGLIVMVRRRVCKPIVDLTATMSRLASGDMSRRNFGRRARRRDRRDGGRRPRLQGQHDQGRPSRRGEGTPRTTSRCGAPRCSTNSPARSKPRSANSSAGCRRPPP